MRKSRWFVSVIPAPLHNDQIENELARELKYRVLLQIFRFLWKAMHFASNLRIDYTLGFHAAVDNFVTFSQKHYVSSVSLTIFRQ